MVCPKCGHVFSNSDCYSTEQDGDIYINYISAYCTWCRKYYEWKEIFTLSEVTYPVEMEEE